MLNPVQIRPPARHRAVTHTDPVPAPRAEFFIEDCGPLLHAMVAHLRRLAGEPVAAIQLTMVNSTSRESLLECAAGLEQLTLSLTQELEHMQQRHAMQERRIEACAWIRIDALAQSALSARSDCPGGDVRLIHQD